MPPAGDTGVMLRRSSVLLLITTALIAASAPGAGASVYWANGSIGSIGRANPDGSAAKQTFIAGIGAAWVAVDGGHVYWTTQTTNSIGRANLDGSGLNPDFITGATSPTGVSVDSGHVYWANHNNTIGRANLNGSGVNQGFITGANSPAAVAVAGGSVYWTNSGNWTIGRANADGSAVDQSFIKLDPAVSSLLGLAVGGGSVYWSNHYSIGRADLDGTKVNENFHFNSASSAVGGVAVDSGHIYWATADSSSIIGTEGIGRANLDGSAVNESFISASGPIGVAVDSGAAPSTSLVLRMTGASRQILRKADSMRVVFGCNLDCTVDIAARLTINRRTTASWNGSVTVSAGRHHAVRFKLSSRWYKVARAALRARKRVRLGLLVRAHDAATGAVTANQSRVWVVALR